MRFWESVCRLRHMTGRYGRKTFVLGMIGLALLLGGGRWANAQVLFFAGTGHYYEAVASPVNWGDARDAAAARTYLGLPGHLVTINSPAEQTFINSSFPVTQTAVYWIGAYQDKTGPGFSEPAGGFRWVTGEPWQYTAWNSGEPNNAGGFGPSEDFVILASNGFWNDFGTAITTANGYLVEYELPRPFFDVNRDGYSDIAFQNTSTNQVSYWQMKGTTYSGTASTSTIPAPGFVLRGTGDFNGDGNSDLVYQSAATGQIAIWFLNGTKVIGAQSVINYPVVGYVLVGVGDFNGDGKPDLVFQNNTSGRIAIWYMDGANLIGYDSTQAVPATGYRVVGVGDFNGDGKSDLVFQNTNSGAVVFWYMNGAQYQSGQFASANPYPSFKVVGINDYNNDGQPDLLFQNTSSGQIAIWYMNGATLIGGGAVGVIPDSNLVVAGPR